MPCYTQHQPRQIACPYYYMSPSDVYLTLMGLLDGPAMYKGLGSCIMYNHPLQGTEPPGSPMRAATQACLWAGYDVHAIIPLKGQNDTAHITQKPNSNPNSAASQI